MPYHPSSDPFSVVPVSASKCDKDAAEMPKPKGRDIVTASETRMDNQPIPSAPQLVIRPVQKEEPTSKQKGGPDPLSIDMFSVVSMPPVKFGGEVMGLLNIDPNKPSIPLETLEVKQATPLPPQLLIPPTQKEEHTTMENSVPGHPSIHPSSVFPVSTVTCLEDVELLRPKGREDIAHEVIPIKQPTILAPQLVICPVQKERPAPEKNDSSDLFSIEMDPSSVVPVSAAECVKEVMEMPKSKGNDHIVTPDATPEEQPAPSAPQLVIPLVQKEEPAVEEKGAAIYPSVGLFAVVPFSAAKCGEEVTEKSHNVANESPSAPETIPEIQAIPSVPQLTILPVQKEELGSNQNGWA